MVYSYAGKKDRKYPYYVCRQAQRQGWAACPSRSLPTRVIEEAVLARLREARPGSLDAAAWEQMDRSRQMGVLQAMIERIGYDGRTRQISIRFHPTPVGREEARAGEEARG